MICSPHFHIKCFARAFDPRSHRPLRHGSLPSIWEKKESSKERDSTRQCHMKKEQEKVRFLGYTIAFLRIE